MCAMEPLAHLIGTHLKNFSKEERSLLEAEIFTRVCDELKELFRKQFKSFFSLMKFTKIQEEMMLEKNFIKNILNDILSTGEYNIQGIACYTDMHEDVICEFASGLNTEPLATCLRRVIELHRLVRPELYQAIAKKIIASYLNALK